MPSGAFVVPDPANPDVPCIAGMEEVGLVLIGIIGGAVATGGVTLFTSWRERQNSRTVAARLILGDLYVLEAMAELVLKYERWPDRLDLESPLQTWREARGAFAGDVEAWEWALVDSVFSNLHRNSLMVQLGESVSDRALAVMARFSNSIPPAREVVLKRASTEKERAKMVEELSKRKHQVIQDSAPHEDDAAAP